jgi:hypothetical protein
MGAFKRKGEENHQFRMKKPDVQDFGTISLLAASVLSIS